MRSSQAFWLIFIDQIPTLNISPFLYSISMQSLATIYNLYSPSPLPLATTPASPKPPKKQIQIVFHHPNLLYLQKKRPKGREQISQEVEEHNIRIMKNKKFRKLETQQKEERRPKTCDPWAGDSARISNNRTDMRCRTSHTNKRTETVRNLQGKLQIFGKSSTGGSFFDQTPRTFTQTGPKRLPRTKTAKKQTLLNLLETASVSSKVPLWQNLFTTPSNKQEVKVSISLEIEKKFLKYNNPFKTGTNIGRKVRVVR